MELIPDSVCVLCEEKTSLLSKKCMQPYIKIIGDTFFEAQKRVFIQFQKKITNTNFCALCIQKIVISNRFKDSYEVTIGKRRNFKKSRASCFLCEKKGVDLLNTTENPNGFSTKITLFMNSNSHPTSHEECAVCFDCLFDINIWYEAHINLFEKFKLTEGKVQHANHNSSSADHIIKKDKENVTPPHNNIQGAKKKLFQSSTDKSSSNPIRNSNRRSAPAKMEVNMNRSSKHFHQLIKKQLRRFKILKQIKKNEINWPPHISSDPKMFYKIPYVLLSREEFPEQSEGLTRRSSRGKTMEVIVLSDSDDGKSERVVPKLCIRTPRRKSFPKLRIKTTPTQYICNVCDLEFYDVCKYKSHTLWHEKPDHVKINLVRSNLPTQTKASEFNSRITTETSNVAEDVNDAVVSPINELLPEVTNEPADAEVSFNSEAPSDSIDNPEDIPNLEVPETNSADELSKVESLGNESVNIPSPTEELDSDREIDLSDKSKTVVLPDVQNKSDDGIENGIAHESGENDQLVSEDLSLSDKRSNEINNTATDINASPIDSDNDSTHEYVERALSTLHDSAGDKSDSDICDDTNIRNSNSMDMTKRKRLISSGSSDYDSEGQLTSTVKKVRFAIDYSIPKNRDVTEAMGTNPAMLNSSDEFVDASEGDAITNI